LDITANNQSKTYGVTFSFAGTEFTTGAGQLVNGDTVTSVTLISAGAAGTATVVAPGPTYNITPSAAVGTGLGNYTIAFHLGNLTVNRRGLDVTANNQNKTYGATFTFAGTEFTTLIGQLVNGDSVTSVGLTSAGAAGTATVTTPGPNYAILPSAAVGSGLGNYNISYHSGTLHVNTQAASVTPNVATKVYGSADPALTGTTTGFLTGDSVTATYSRTAGETVAGSPYTISATLSPAGVLGNYSITYNTANFTITTASLTITADSIVGTPAVDPFTKVYNGLVYTGFTVRYSGFVNGETPSVLGGSLSFSGAGTTATLPGTYTDTVTPGGLTSMNYTITFVKGTLKITYGSCGGSDPGGIILPPINADGSSVYKRKAGSTIPVKFKVCDAAGNSISDPNAVFINGCCGSVNMTSRMRGTVDNVNEAGDTYIPDVAFTYTGGQWHFNMDTGNLDAGYTYTFVIALKYGSITFIVGTK
jgi:hypothetical protein